MTTTTQHAPVRATMEEQEHWFFIVGCQRSGTTLLRLVLECHSRIQCWDETRAYAVISGRRKGVRERPLLGLKIPCLTEQLANPSFWDPYVMPETPNIYRGQRLVFLTRDVRDTIRSMQELRRHGRSFLETHILPVLREKSARDGAFRRRYADEIARLPLARHPKLAAAAFYWRYKTEVLFDYLERGFPLLLLRYEDLVHQPHLELIRVCGFLQASWERGLLQHETFAHTQLTDGRATGDTDPNRAIDDRSVGRWQDAFTDDQLDEILHFAGDAQAHLYR